MPAKDIDIKKFAEQVERLCQFLMDKLEKTGTNDLKIIEDLMEDAADIQLLDKSDISIIGLADYMNGAPNESSS